VDQKIIFICAAMSLLVSVSHAKLKKPAAMQRHRKTAGFALTLNAGPMATNSASPAAS
jgi:hypothetical protein